MAEIPAAVRMGFCREMYTVARLIRMPNPIIHGRIRFTSPLSAIHFICSAKAGSLLTLYLADTRIICTPAARPGSIPSGIANAATASPSRKTNWRICRFVAPTARSLPYSCTLSSIDT